MQDLERIDQEYDPRTMIILSKRVQERIEIERNTDKLNFADAVYFANVGARPGKSKYTTKNYQRWQSALIRKINKLTNPYKKQRTVWDDVMKLPRKSRRI